MKPQERHILAKLHRTQPDGEVKFSQQGERGSQNICSHCIVSLLDYLID